MIISDDLYKKLQEIIVLPTKDVASAQFILRAKQPVQVIITMNVRDKDGRFVLNHDVIETEDREYKLVKKGLPVICSCCGRYVKYV